ncbi:MAG TPA: hypothetical protein VEY95_01845 [Azospirillaceae bacterium]|nr:hypothetical protein [Azospirillaceae bacterium]
MRRLEQRDRARPVAVAATGTVGRVNRAFDHVANGVLLFVIFHGLIRLMTAKGGMLADAAVGWWPALADLDTSWLLTDAGVPFLCSALAAFVAHAGLRWVLKRLRLRLSAGEQEASAVFMGVVGLFAVAGIAFDWHSGLEFKWLTHLAVVLGAWAGIAARRRVRI